jgi:hypothetical protein
MGSPAEILVWAAVTLGLLLVGVVAFFLLLVAGAFRLLGRLLGLFSGRRMTSGHGLERGPAVCRQPRCGQVNSPGSRFCARCGARLSPAAYDDHSYG